MKHSLKVLLSLLLLAAVVLVAEYARVADNGSFACATATANQFAAAALSPKPFIVAPNEKTVAPRPFLLWNSVDNAVYYEIEFTHAPPENPNGVFPSRHRIFASRAVFTHGYNPDLPAMSRPVVYWRVRGLDAFGQPVGVFSDARELVIDPAKKERRRPLITSDFEQKGIANLLYPVYTWIPLLETMTYEVEVTRTPPENPDDSAPSRHRIWSAIATGFSCYDDTPRLQPGPYYYRVRGVKADGKPLGVWSEADRFYVDPSRGAYAATFGDSITHGGGAISYSPSDWEYDYQSYLKFPTYNLGRSGDTAATSAARFDQDVPPFQPRFLLIMTGINSLRAGVAAESVIQDLLSIRDSCLEMNTRPIFLTLPPVNPAAILRTFNEPTAPGWRQELLQVNDFIRRQPYFIDLHPHFTDSAGELPLRFATDGLHYDIAGKKLMAEIINAEWERVTR